MKEEEKKWVCMVGDKHIFKFKTKRGLIQHLNRNPYHKEEKIVKLHRKKWCINCQKKRMKGVFVPFEEKGGYEIGKIKKIERRLK
jgi:hypothetical protein